MNCELLEVLTGIARAFGPHGEPSAIAKVARDGAVYVDNRGLAGDEQADPRHHGGPEKAVHHYALEHYAQWKRQPGASAGLFETAGVFGENFSTLGMTEASVCVGDVFQAGGSRLQVSQARQPCWKLDVRTGIRGMAADVQESGRTGWYYRVLAPGWVGAGERLLLLERPNPEWPLQRLLHYLYVDPLDAIALAEIRSLEALTESWRHLAETRLRTRRVEDWTRRLSIPG